MDRGKGKALSLETCDARRGRDGVECIYRWFCERGVRGEGSEASVLGIEEKMKSSLRKKVEV